jgi:hypothetical protein
VSSLILVFRKRFGAAMMAFFGGLLPILIFGTYSLSQGGFFLPNSILLKGVSPLADQLERSFYRLLEERWETSRDSLELSFLSLGTLVIQLLRKREKFDRLAVMNLAVLLGSLLQTFFIGNNYFYRYEANLICAGLVVSVTSLQDLLRKRQALWPGGKAWVVYFILLAWLAWNPVPELWKRTWESLEKLPTATTNIYEQQVQMGRFLRQYYNGKTIAANDIGAINYLADIRTLDLYGLSTQAVADHKLAGTYDRQSIARLVEQESVDIAVVYDHWYDAYGGLPKEWIKVGEWQITHNVVCGGEVVSFYAVRLVEAPALLQNLAAFSAQLPKTVIQRQRGFR